jgi:predicted metalloenzyme YecM
MKQIIGDYEAFVRQTNEGLRRVGIKLDELAMLDHICYRVETLERYQEMLRLLGGRALLLGEAEISNRLIATFEFEEPLKIDGWRVPYLELPQPKAGSPYAEGLEHAEFVVVKSLRRFQAEHSELPFATGEMRKPVNPGLGLRLKQHHLSVKFHEQPLGAVVRIEQKLAARGIKL